MSELLWIFGTFELALIGIAVLILGWASSATGAGSSIADKTAEMCQHYDISNIAKIRLGEYLGFRLSC